MLQYVAMCHNLLHIKYEREVSDLAKLVLSVCCSVLQCVVVCCSVLQRVAACCNVLQFVAVCCSVLQSVAMCCSMLQCVAVCCSVLQIIYEHKVANLAEVGVALYSSVLQYVTHVLQCVAVCCSVLHCIAACCSMSHVCCSVLQCVAVYSSVLQYITSVLQCVCSVLQCSIFRFEHSSRCRSFERWGAGVETQKNVRGEIGGWGRVPFNEPYAPSLGTIYDGA